MRHPIQFPNYMGCLMKFYMSLYQNEFQNPHIFQQTISLFPEQSTLVVSSSNICVVHLQNKVTPSTKALCPGASFQNRSY
jgi:hypothetical protein